MRPAAGPSRDRGCSGQLLAYRGIQERGQQSAVVRVGTDGAGGQVGRLEVGTTQRRECR
jgi:hypothetical protein